MLFRVSFFRPEEALAGDRVVELDLERGLAGQRPERPEAALQPHADVRAARSCRRCVVERERRVLVLVRGRAASASRRAPAAASGRSRPPLRVEQPGRQVRRRVRRPSEGSFGAPLVGRSATHGPVPLGIPPPGVAGAVERRHRDLVDQRAAAPSARRIVSPPQLIPNGNPAPPRARRRGRRAARSSCRRGKRSGGRPAAGRGRAGRRSAASRTCRPVGGRVDELDPVRALAVDLVEDDGGAGRGCANRERGQPEPATDQDSPRFAHHRSSDYPIVGALAQIELPVDGLARRAAWPAPRSPADPPAGTPAGCGRRRRGRRGCRARASRSPPSAGRAPPHGSTSPAPRCARPRASARERRSRSRWARPPARGARRRSSAPSRCRSRRAGRRRAGAAAGSGARACARRPARGRAPPCPRRTTCSWSRRARARPFAARAPPRRSRGAGAAMRARRPRAVRRAARPSRKSRYSSCSPVPAVTMLSRRPRSWAKRIASSARSRLTNDTPGRLLPERAAVGLAHEDEAGTARPAAADRQPVDAQHRSSSRCDHLRRPARGAHGTRRRRASRSTASRTARPRDSRAPASSAGPRRAATGRRRSAGSPSRGPRTRRSRPSALYVAHRRARCPGRSRRGRAAAAAASAPR